MINVVLYEPEIPGNTGNIMRTCKAFGIRLHLIEPLGFRLDEKKVRRAGMDYLLDLDYTVYTDYEDFLSKNEGEFYYVTRYGEVPPDTYDYKEAKGDIYLVFGKESTGIPYHILHDHFDHCMRIPMVEDARSLNLSNCVALVTYEVLRQLEYPHLSRHEVIKGEGFVKNFED